MIFDYQAPEGESLEIDEIPFISFFKVEEGIYREGLALDDGMLDEEAIYDYQKSSVTALPQREYLAPPTPLPPTETTLYLVDFAEGLSPFTTSDSLGAQSWQWYEGSNYSYAEMSGFDSDVEENKDNLDLLISDAITLPESGTLSVEFFHLIAYGTNPEEDLKVYVSTGYHLDPNNHRWEELQGIIFPEILEGDNYSDYESSGKISLDQYLGKTITLAFEYKSSTDQAMIWRIVDVAIIAE